MTILYCAIAIAYDFGSDIPPPNGGRISKPIREGYYLKYKVEQKKEVELERIAVYQGSRKQGK